MSTMPFNGLSKLMEECGELVQICAKKQAYMDTDVHPDGKGSMKTRLEEEIGDVIASCRFVSEKFDLNEEAIFARVEKKLNLYYRWDKE